MNNFLYLGYPDAYNRDDLKNMGFDSPLKKTKILSPITKKKYPFKGIGNYRTIEKSIIPDPMEITLSCRDEENNPYNFENITF